MADLRAFAVGATLACLITSLEMSRYEIRTGSEFCGSVSYSCLTVALSACRCALQETLNTVSSARSDRCRPTAMSSCLGRVSLPSPHRWWVSTLHSAAIDSAFCAALPSRHSARLQVSCGSRAFEPYAKHNLRGGGDQLRAPSCLVSIPLTRWASPGATLDFVLGWAVFLPGQPCRGDALCLNARPSGVGDDNVVQMLRSVLRDCSPTLSEVFRVIYSCCKASARV
jgi:hypothetical protein